MTTLSTTRQRPPFWRDVRILRVVAQVVAVAITAAVLYVLWFNLTNNLKRQGIPTGFGYLSNPIGVDIADSGLSPGAAVWRGLLIGVKNTLALAVVGLPLLTVIGVVVGVARLSTNWLVAKLAAVYVETLRNIPPLLIIFFAFNAVILRLPPPRSPSNPLGLFVVSNLRITVPWIEAGEGARAFWWVVAAGVVAAFAVGWWRTRRFEETGEPHHRILWGLGAVLVAALVGYVALGGPVGLSVPTLDGRTVTGGFSGLGAYFAVLAALVLYTASHVAEIVRGSILAVPKGQTEAANALALSGFQRLRHVVLPQAMRIAIPPTINQYLNYVKNTSLAIAVAYAEMTRITFQVIGNGSPAPQSILLLMAGYLVLFSIPISLVVNVVNRRLQLVTQ